jgi:hypothetical protein
MITTLLVTAALLVQTPVSGASVSGTVINAATGKPVENARVTLARTDITPQASVRNPLPATRLPADVFLPGEWWNQLAGRNAADSVAAAGATAGATASDIRQILVRPDGTVAVALTDPATTDRDGRFLFKDARPGAYRLVVIANGYAQQEYDGRAGVAPILLAAGHSIDVQVPILPTGAVSGQIRDSFGEPLPDITVHLIRFAYDAAGRKKSRAVASSHTNDRGEYRLFFIPPGRYYLQAGSSYGDSNPSSSDLAARAADHVIQDRFANTFYPGVNDVESAAVIEVKPGSELERINLSMSRLPGFRIRGKIVSAGKDPAKWTEIYLSSGSSVGSAEGRAEHFPARVDHDSQNGFFEIRDVPPGSYAITIRGESEFGVFGPVEISNAGKDLGEVRVGPPIPVTGAIRIDRQGPAAPTLIKLKVQLSPAFLDFQPFWSDGNPEASPAADGAFRYNRVVPGDYRVSVLNMPDGIYVKEIRFGETDVMRNSLQIRGPATDALEIVLGSDPGRIQGRSSDLQGGAARGSQIVLAPDQRSRKDLFKVATADVNGLFTFAGVPPGDYKVFAWEALEPYSFFDPEVLRSVEAQGVSVRVTPAATDTINIRSISDAR